MRRLFVTLPAQLAVACFCLLSAAQGADQFTVNGIHVDAQGASTSVARDYAFAQGRPKAWQVIFRRLTRQQDWSKQPQLDDTQLQRLIRSFTVSNERRSTTRYVADINYVFNPAAVAKVLRESSLAFATAPTKPILLVPLNPGFALGSPWVQAFNAPRFADAIVPFRLPVADVLDSQVLAHVNLQQASWLDVEPVAARVHATEAVLVLVERTPRKNSLTLTLKRIGISELPMMSTVDVPFVQTAAATYPSAADAAMSAIAELWKEKAAVDYSQRGRITVDVRIASLAQWGSYQSALASVPNVTGFDILAMDVGEARISLSYLGTPEQLRDALGQAGLILANADGEWSLRTGTPPQTPPEQATATQAPQPAQHATVPAHATKPPQQPSHRP